jgi:hypothetical protein
MSDMPTDKLSDTLPASRVTDRAEFETALNALRVTSRSMVVKRRGKTPRAVGRNATTWTRCVPMDVRERNGRA